MQFIRLLFLACSADFDILCSDSFSYLVKFYSFIFLHKLSTRVVCVDGKHPRCQVYVYLPFSEESFNVQRKRFHVWAIAYSEKTALKKLYAEGQKLTPMDYSNFYMVSEFVRVNWKTCQVFPWQGERFVRFPHSQLPKETYFIGVRVKEGGGGGKRSFLLSLSSPPYPSPTPPALTCSNASTSSELNTAATPAETLEAHVGECSYRNFCRARCRLQDPTDCPCVSEDATLIWSWQ